MTRLRFALFLASAVLALISTHIDCVNLDGAYYFNRMFPIVFLIIILFFNEISLKISHDSISNLKKILIKSTEEKLDMHKEIHNQASTILKLKKTINEISNKP